MATNSFPNVDDETNAIFLINQKPVRFRIDGFVVACVRPYSAKTSIQTKKVSTKLPANSMEANDTNTIFSCNKLKPNNILVTL